MNPWWLRVLTALVLGTVVMAMTAGCAGEFVRPQVRAEHNAAGVQRVDLYVIPNDTRTATSITNRQPMFVGLAQGDISQYASVASGDYEFVFANWNTKTVRARDYLNVRSNRRVTVRLDLGGQQQPVIGFDIQTM